MKGFESFLISSKIEESLYKEQRELFEKVSMSKDEFVKAMIQLYDMGNQEAIERASNMMADIEVERLVNQIFDEKAPNAAEASREKVMLEIKKLKIAGDEKVELAKGILSGDAYDIAGAVRKKGVVKLQSIVDKKYKGAMELLPWFVKWDASPGAGNRGKASSELFFIIASKNGRTPTKGDAIVDGINVELKSYNSAKYNFEFTVSGKQHYGDVIRDAWAAEAEKMYKSKGKAFHKKYWVEYEKNPAIKEMPFGVSRGKKAGANYLQLTAPMNALCFNLQTNGGMSTAQVNKWVNSTTKKVFKSRSIPDLPIWDGKKFHRTLFMQHWTACAFDHYKSIDKWNVITSIAKNSMTMISLTDGKQLIALGDAVKPYGISMNSMPGQNSSIAAGYIKL